LFISRDCRKPADDFKNWIYLEKILCLERIFAGAKVAYFNEAGKVFLDCYLGWKIYIFKTDTDHRSAPALVTTQ
jgi:hypothetical protein